MMDINESTRNDRIASTTLYLPDGMSIMRPYPQGIQDRAMLHPRRDAVTDRLICYLVPHEQTSQQAPTPRSVICCQLLLSYDL